MSGSQEEATTQLAQALAVLLHPDDTDVQTFEQVVSATLAAQQTQQVAMARAVGADANCRITRVDASCPRATQELAPATHEAAPAALRGPIRWGGGSTITVGNCTVTVEWECTRT
jgi:hypothetical protein